MTPMVMACAAGRMEVPVQKLLVQVVGSLKGPEGLGTELQVYICQGLFGIYIN